MSGFTGRLLAEALVHVRTIQPRSIRAMAKDINCPLEQLHALKPKSKIDAHNLGILLVRLARAMQSPKNLISLKDLMWFNIVCCLS